MKTRNKSRKKSMEVLSRNEEFESIVYAVCRAFHITEAEFFSGRRLEPLATARFCYWHILQKVHNMGLSQIGRQCGYTHGSIFHGINRVKDELKVGNEAFKSRFAMIVNELGIQKYYEIHKGVAASV